MNKMLACLGLFWCAAAGPVLAQAPAIPDGDAGSLPQANSIAEKIAHESQAVGRQSRDHRGSGAQRDFVRVCGESLCLGDQPFFVRGASIYGAMDHPGAEMALAKAAGLNTIEIVEYEMNYHDLNSATAEDTWQRVDRNIAEAGKNGLHVILHLASYGWSVEKAGQNPVTTDWEPLFKFVAGRVNTVTHVPYVNDPTIAIIELFGEIRAPYHKTHGFPLSGTKEQINSFFSRSLAEWKKLDPNHIVSSGGLSYLGWNSGIDWKTIVSDRNDAICDLETNADTDYLAVKDFTQQCKDLGKPWLLAAWSSCIKKAPDFKGDINYVKDDAGMAAHLQDMYNLALGKAFSTAQPAMASAGSVFWNLGPYASIPTCDIGPQTPETFEELTKDDRLKDSNRSK
jgi:hypothetical protein